MKERQSYKIRWKVTVLSSGKTGASWTREYHARETKRAPFNPVFLKNLIETGRASLQGARARYEAELID